MVLRHESPVAGIRRTVAVVAHHPIIVELKRIVVGLLVIDIDFPVAHLQVVAFIDAYGPLIDREVGKGQMNRAPALGNPEFPMSGRVQP